jgi:hypothetical protein
VLFFSTLSDQCQKVLLGAKTTFLAKIFNFWPIFDDFEKNWSKISKIWPFFPENIDIFPEKYHFFREKYQFFSGKYQFFLLKISLF